MFIDTTPYTKEVTILSSEFRRPNGIALHEVGGACTLFVTETGHDEEADEEGLNGVYMLRDKKGCFQKDHGPFNAQLLTQATQGIQDGVMVHRQSETLMYCDGMGVWFWSLQSWEPIGIVPVESGCTQLVITDSEPGLNILYVLAETRLYSIDLDIRAGVPSGSSAANLRRLGALRSLCYLVGLCLVFL